MIYSSTLTLAMQSALLLASAGLTAWLLRRQGAALRHYVWTLSLGLLLLLPLWPEQRFRVAVPIDRTASTQIVVTPDDGPARRNLDGVATLRNIWLAGVVMLLARIAVSHLRGAALLGGAAPWRHSASWGHTASRRHSASRRHTASLASGIAVPMVIGIVVPKILLPTDAVDWDADRLDAVLAHERMHILRHDLIWQLLAQIACAVYWPNPLVWLAARLQHKECEQACDDGGVSAMMSARYRAPSCKRM